MQESIQKLAKKANKHLSEFKSPALNGASLLACNGQGCSSLQQISTSVAL